MDTQLVVKDLLTTRCLRKGQIFKLASGGESSVYVDCKGITLHAPSLKPLAKLFWDTWDQQGLRPTVIAGVSVGGDPLATAIALEGWDRHQTEIEILLVRKQKKDHGGSQGRAVEGRAADQLKGKIFLVEDVVSTGGSSATALRYLKEEGYVVQGFWSILDREMGGLASIGREFSIPVNALFKLSEL